jgi:hypothetical protein
MFSQRRSVRRESIINQKNMRFLLWMFFLLLATLFSCTNYSPKQKKVLIPSFYYWKTTLNWGKNETAIANNTKLQKLYIRFFDVEWSKDAGAIPRGSITAHWEDFPKNITVVPVVFIRQEVFSKETTAEKLEKLAENLSFKINQIADKQTFKEIQIDCDWTSSTRDAYFHFLKILKRQHPQCQITATLRLWQSKYRTKAGIPPCDRVTLMAYNFERPNQKNIQNSILDLKEATAYLGKQATYPLPMDVALPLFAWAVHFKNNEFSALLSLPDPEILTNKLYFAQENEKNWFTCQRDTLLRDTYIRTGERLRYERASTEDIVKIKYLALQLSPQDTVYMTLFHFDQSTLSNYAPKNIQYLLQNSAN